MTTLPKVGRWHCALAVALLLTALCVYFGHSALERPVLRLAGLMIGGARRHPGVCAALVAALLAVVWAFIGWICYQERGLAANGDEAAN